MRPSIYFTSYDWMYKSPELAIVDASVLGFIYNWTKLKGKVTKF